MERTIGLGHFRYHRGHVVQFLLILDLCPFVLAVRQIFLIVLYRIVVGIKQIFKIIESDNIIMT